MKFYEKLSIESLVVPCGQTDGRTGGQTDRQTDRHEEANSRFSQLRDRTQKRGTVPFVITIHHISDACVDMILKSFGIFFYNET